jgi:hypothetical protein
MQHELHVLEVWLQERGKHSSDGIHLAEGWIIDFAVVHGHQLLPLADPPRLHGLCPLGIFQFLLFLKLVFINVSCRSKIR